MKRGGEFLFFKRTDPVPYLIEISRLEYDMHPNGFSSPGADEMMLCFVGKELVGKIEFSQNGAYMDWILAKKGYGYYIFQEFAKTRGAEKITFKVMTSPTESKETLLRRMNFYQRLQCKYIDARFNEEDGATWFVCEYIKK
jgi:hypothetical protein